MGRSREAVEYFKRAARGEPLLRRPSIMLQEAYFTSGDSQGAAAEFERAKTLPGPDAISDSAVVKEGMTTGDRSKIEWFLNTHPAPENAALMAGLDKPAVALAELKRQFAMPKLRRARCGST